MGARETHSTVACPKRRAFLLLLGLTLVGQPATATLSPQEAQTLAHRFRPYIKSTLEHRLGGSPDERYHPCNWQWFISHCNLRDSNQVTLITAQEMADDPTKLISLPGADVSIEGAGAQAPGYDLALVDEQDRQGEIWSDVIRYGHGIYAHVEEVDDKIVNIEYTVL
jgi:hypothetical protein